MPAHPSLQDLDQLDPRHFIIVKGARVNNLKNLSVAIPRNQLIAITGLSGSGKSSLAGTIFSKGRQMYMEGLSPYIRQLLGKVEKPVVDSIRGLSPAVAIEQRTHHANPRSTVGTVTEIYDYLKLLYARIGVTYSPVSGEKVTKQTVEDVIGYIYTFPMGTKVLVGYRLEGLQSDSWEEQLSAVLAKGFTRIAQGSDTYLIEELIASPSYPLIENEPIYVVIDRFSVEATQPDDVFRLTDSIRTAFFEGQGKCYVRIVGKEEKMFSDQLERDGIRFEVPSVNLFSFNNAYGACKKCDGLGKVTDIDPEKVIPNRLLSVYEGAIHPWKSSSMASWLKPLLAQKAHKDFPIHRPYKDLSADEKKLLWEGDGDFKGIHAFLEHLQAGKKTLSTSIFLSQYRGVVPCPSCQGTRLRHDATYVKIGHRSITGIAQLPITELITFFATLDLRPAEQKIAERLLIEVNSRLAYMDQVGLGYLTLVRQASTLSGGEYQRIKLATALGSTLVDTLYILDEPTIGLHPRDTQKLVNILIALKNLGNTVIVVDHEEAIVRAADQLIDIGPEAGAKGGELVFQGNWQELAHFNGSYTARYLNRVDKIPLPAVRRTPQYHITFKGIVENNLKDIDFTLPLGIFTVITGVSGSGKSTVVKKIIYPAIANQLGMAVEATGKFDSLEGDYNLIQHLEFVDQNPIGRSTRSNPVTYIKAYDSIRQIFASQPLAKARQYTPGYFSFNTAGGRCETCLGEGKVVIDMQFMADVTLTCEDCNGNRFKDDVLEVTYRGKNIIEVLNLTVDEAWEFFKGEISICRKLQSLQAVGLGYVPLGQSASLLSGGEAQRLKLATYLIDKGAMKLHTLFILDEPTKGLHVHDIRKLLATLQRLVQAGHTVLVIEHTMELIQCADWIIDLGPEGGDQGGEIVCSGTPEQIVDCSTSHTARYLKEKLAE